MGVRGIQIGEEVSIDIVKQAFADSGLSKAELARRMGWMNLHPNVSNVNRALGITGDGNGRKPRNHTTYGRGNQDD